MLYFCSRCKLDTSEASAVDLLSLCMSELAACQFKAPGFKHHKPLKPSSPQCWEAELLSLRTATAEQFPGGSRGGGLGTGCAGTPPVRFEFIASLLFLAPDLTSRQSSMYVSLMPKDALGPEPSTRAFLGKAGE